jgi:hypothetical protein
MAGTVSNRIKHQDLKTLTNCKEDGRHSEQQNQTSRPQNTHQLQKKMADTVSNRIKHQDLKTLTSCKDDGKHSEQHNQTSRPQNTYSLQRGWQAQ